MSKKKADYEIEVVKEDFEIFKLHLDLLECDAKKIQIDARIKLLEIKKQFNAFIENYKIDFKVTKINKH